MNVPGARPRIVIAEDEAIIRMDLREMLQEEGYEVVGEASDGDAAVRLAEETHPDLVVLDIFMPGMDGLAAAGRIAEQQLAPVLILTAFSQRELVERAARAGAMSYLVKPFGRRDLIPAIEVAIARWEEGRELAAESRDLAERLQARKVVDRAKGKLMDERGLSEGDAFKMIRNSAMRHRVTLKRAAEMALDEMGEERSGGV